MNEKPFFKGVPTKVETDRLMEIMAEYTEGDTIPYERIENEIGCSRQNNRGSGIMTAWKRRAYRERNLLLVANKRIGYRIANPKERVMVTCSMVSQSRRRIIKAAAIAETTDAARLTSEEQKTRSALMTIPARLRLAELTAPKLV